jgi:Fe(3+) dicitrate transport protein
VSFKWQRQLDDATQFEVLTYYTDSFRGSAIASRDMKTLSSYPRNYHTFAIEPRVSRVFFVGPTTQEVSGLSLPEGGDARAIDRLALIDNVPT